MNAFRPSSSGIVQGLTEFLPISSTAHLRIVPASSAGRTRAPRSPRSIQLGTMAAVLLYFRHDLWNIASAWLRELRDPTRARTPRRAARAGSSSSARSRSRSSASLFKDQIETGARDAVR